MTITLAPSPILTQERTRITRRVRASNALVESLIREGVTHIFGVPGGASLPIYDAFYDYPQVKHLLMRHEQSAVHAAAGYARASGRAGVCCATSGPGATNLVTGLADAMMDSTSVVAITGQVVTNWLGRDGFQEADITGVTLAITKHNWLVMNPDDISATVHDAFHLATAGRQAPVLVDIPRDVLQREIDFDSDEMFSPHRHQPPRHADPQVLTRAAQAISQSNRPILYVGGGAISSDAWREVRQLAEKTRIPVTTTLMGKGAFPESHPQSVGMLGMHGTAYANYAMHESDLIIAVGARFDDRVTGKLAAFAPRAKVVHIDVDASEFHKNRKADYPLLGDARTVLTDLIPLVSAPDTEAWWQQIDEWRAKYPLRYYQNGKVIKPQFAIDLLYQLTKDQRPIVTVDVGQHQMWAAQFFKSEEPRTFITSGGLGTMGFSLPAALGAQCAEPDRLVLNINGDGSFQMTMQALITAVEEKLPLKVFIINNNYLGMVRQWQELFYKERYHSVYLRNPNFARVAESLGAVGMSVTYPDELEAIYRRALAVTDHPVVVDVHCDSSENCFPMIPSGQSIHEMVIEDPRYAKDSL